MKQLTTIISCMLFLVAGIISIGFTNTNKEAKLFPGNATAYASSELNHQIPGLRLPLDLQLDLNKRASRDTVYVETTDTVVKTKYVTKKVCKDADPQTVGKDTLFVPIFYIATPLEHEVESTEIRVIDNVQIIDFSETNQTDSIERID